MDTTTTEAGDGVVAMVTDQAVGTEKNNKRKRTQCDSGTKPKKPRCSAAEKRMAKLKESIAFLESRYQLFGDVAVVRLQELANEVADAGFRVAYRPPLITWENYARVKDSIDDSLTILSRYNREEEEYRAITEALDALNDAEGEYMKYDSWLGSNRLKLKELEKQHAQARAQ